MKVYLITLILALSCTSLPRNAKFMDPKCDAEAWNRGFQTPDKDVTMFKKDIIAHLPLKAGEAVADIGAGTGQFEKALSEKVGTKGKVFAVEVAPSFIPFMKKRFQEEQLKNVEVVQSLPESTTLKENSVNLALVIDTYHHFEMPIQMLNDISRILKKDGHLVIVDMRRGPGASAWVNEHMDLSIDDIIKQVTENGFTFIQEENIPFKESFQLTFRKI